MDNVELAGKGHDLAERREVQIRRNTLQLFGCHLLSQ